MFPLATRVLSKLVTLCHLIRNPLITFEACAALASLLSHWDTLSCNCYIYSRSIKFMTSATASFSNHNTADYRSQEQLLSSSPLAPRLISWIVSGNTTHLRRRSHKFDSQLVSSKGPGQTPMLKPSPGTVRPCLQLGHKNCVTNKGCLFLLLCRSSSDFRPFVLFCTSSIER